MPFDCRELTDEQLDELIKRMPEAIKARNELVELLRYAPSVNLINTIRNAARLKEVLTSIPLALWVDLVRFINCNIEALYGKRKEDLIKILELIEAHLVLEQDDPSLGLSGESIGRALQDVRQVKDGLSGLDDAAAIDAVGRLKERLRLDIAAFWLLLRSVYHSGLLDDLAGAADETVRPVIGRLIKWIIQKLIERIIKRKLPEQSAKKAIPMVGPVLTAIELIGYGALLASIDDLQREISAALCCIVRELDRRGHGWPLTHAQLYFNWESARRLAREATGSDDWMNFTLTVENILYCSFLNEMNECEWSQRGCLVPFRSGLVHKIILSIGPLIVPAGAPAPDGSIWFENDINDSAIPNLPCMRGEQGQTPIACFISTRMSLRSIKTDPYGYFYHSQEIINGVQHF
ncbi:MAG: hypothetical protein LZF61_00650 [Nitrosomonas sp.]|nr:MAG: hypothetical protein LZF61_00650 [Nitrosomonas sp.]